jgi:hypothetical protein
MSTVLTKDYTVSGIRNWEKSILIITGGRCRVNHAPAFFLPIDPIIYLAMFDNYHLPPERQIYCSQGHSQRRHGHGRGHPKGKERGRWGKRCSPQGPGRGESRVRNRQRFWVRGGTRQWPSVCIEMPWTRPNFPSAAIAFPSVRPDIPS